MTITCSVEQVRCNLCGASDSAVLCGNDSFNMHLSTVMCRHCGLVYTSPRPTPEAYRRFYRTEFRRFYEDVATPDEWFLEYHDIERVAADRVRAYKSVLSDAKSVLEVGCETGAFLAAVRSTFPVVAIQGLEPAEQFAQFATAHYDVPVMACFLEDNRLVEGAYDVVAMFHVLEHSLDPTRALLEARRLLTRQGRLLIEVPNIRADWHGLGMLHIAHTYAFSPRTLSLLLTKCGFDVVDLNDSAEQPVEVSMSVTAARAECVAPELPPLGQTDSVAEMQELFRRRIGSQTIFLWRRHVRRAAGVLIGARRARTLAKWLRRFGRTVRIPVLR